MTRSGKGTERAGTTSTTTSGSSRSMSAAASARTDPSRPRTTDGLKPGWTSRR